MIRSRLIVPVSITLVAVLVAGCATSTGTTQPSAPAASAGSSSSVAGASASASSGPLTTVRYTIASASISPLNIDFAVAQEAGYMKQEGLQLQIVPLGSNTAATGAVLNGSADIAVGVPSYQIPIVAKGQSLDMVNFFEYTYPFKWAVAVLKNSPYKTLADLKGKTIGVQSFGVSDYTVGQKLFQLAGVNPTTQIHWLATGDLALAAHALASGEVAAEVTYDTTLGSWDALNEVSYRTLPLPAGVPLVGGLYLSTTKQDLQTKKQEMTGFARALAKANYFTMANPLAAAQMFYQLYPQTLPPNKTLAQAAQALVITTARRRQEFNPDTKGEPMGWINPQEWVREVAFAGATGKANPTTFYTDSLIPQIDNFSVSAIQAQAKNWGK